MILYEDTAVTYVAKTIKNDIMKLYQNLSEIEWSLTIEKLSIDNYRLNKAPRSVWGFLEYLLKVDNKEKGLRLYTLVDSF